MRDAVEATPIGQSKGFPAHVRELRSRLMCEAIHDVCAAHRGTEQERLAGLALRTIWQASHTLRPDGPLEPRGLCDRALTGLRSLTLQWPKSLCLRLLGSLFGCGEATTALLVYSDRLSVLTRVGLLVFTHEVKYDLALAKVQAQGRTDDFGLLYAGLSAWPRDEMLDTYISRMGEFERLKIELVIEGPLQLALSLSEEGFLAILRVPLWVGTSTSEPEMADLREAALAVRGKVAHEWEDGWLKALAGLAHESVALFQKNYGIELRRFRTLVPEDSRKRFIAAFENGDYRA